MAEPTHTIVYVRGTWEQERGLGLGVWEKLEARRPGKFRLRQVPYPADYGTSGVPYAESCRIGEANTLAMIRDDELPCILLGYSQGADIAGNVARRILRGQFSKLEISGVALVSDPRRHPGQIWDPQQGTGIGHGIAGERWISETDKIPLWSIVAKDDGITDLPAGSPLRSIADLSAMFSTDPSDARAWFGSIGEKIVRGQLQDWWNPTKAAGWAGAARYAWGYAGPYKQGGGRHTEAYWREGHLDRLADAIAEHVE